MPSANGLTTYFENEYKKEAKYLSRLGIPVTDAFVRSRLELPQPKSLLNRIIDRLFGRR